MGGTRGGGGGVLGRGVLGREEGGVMVINECYSYCYAGTRRSLEMLVMMERRAGQHRGLMRCTQTRSSLHASDS